MSPRELTAAARSLIEDPNAATSILWARAAAVLARQALESQLALVLRELAPGSPSAPFRAQLLCLTALHHDQALAQRVAYTWSALSGATHYHDYEIPPTASELQSWLETVAAFVDAPS